MRLRPPCPFAVWLVVLAGLPALSGCGGREIDPVQKALEATLVRLQHAVNAHDVYSACRLIVPAPSRDGTLGSLSRRQQRLLGAEVRDCEHGFGQHGEFAVFSRGLRGLRVTGVARHPGNVAVAEVKGGPSPRSPHELRFGYIDRQWRLLFGTG